MRGKMQLDQPITRLFSWPIAEIAAALPASEDPLWDQFALRQKAYPAHNRTRTIAIRWSEQLGDGPPVMFPLDYAPQALTAAVMDCAEAIAAHYPGGRIARVLLTEMPAGAEIPRHRDGTSILEQTHRCHVAILTNPDVEFMIDDRPYHMAAGEVYEFDNMRPHAVNNHGTERRVHLICNVFPAQTAG